MPTWAISQGMWHDIFVVGAPVLEKIIRPIVVYFFLVLLLRAFGKRELAQLNPFDLVVLLSLSNTVQNAIIGNDNSLSGGLIGAFTPVSYTHLDVYKRQVEIALLAERIAPAPVVAVLRMVERDFHEPAEAHRAGAADLHGENLAGGGHFHLSLFFGVCRNISTR